jgi:predicted metalloprotease with PDZ domain
MFEKKSVLATLLAFVGSSLVTSTAAPAVLPEPRDVPYPGTIRLEVEATDVDHRVFRVRESVPVGTAGRLTLFYPRWLPGNHSTTGPIEMLAGLQVRSDSGARLDWRRDSEQMHAFVVDVPAGTTRIDLEFQFVTPVSGDQGRRVMTPDLLGLQWEKALLYPLGHYARQITMQPSIRLPPGWHYATALEGGVRTGDTVQFASVSLETLVDSPLFAGPHYKRFELDTDARAPVRLNVFADRPAELEAKPEQIEAHARAVREAIELFGSRHYGHYDFLLAISDHFSSIGLEHHQSSENGVGPGYFIDWPATAAKRELLPHEMVHSWNGKFRRPADLWTPSYEVPMRSSLLWVYEGLTEYYGAVLAGRAGLWSPGFTRAMLADYAASYDVGRRGRQWRNLQDTTQQPIIFYRGTQSYPSWQRGKDYYTEGLLLWLDVDTRIRELTRGRRSLDDFARAFFGVRDGDVAPLTYTFEDVVASLNAVAQYDWAAMLRARLDEHAPGAPLAGIERGGWRLAYRDEPTEAIKASDTANGTENFLYSIGVTLAKDGKVTEVYWDSPAFAAGVAPQMIVVAVNGRAYSAKLLREALKASQADRSQPVELLLRKSDTYSTVKLDYHDGLRYPHLERVESTPDRLGEILRPRTKQKQKQIAEDGQG